MAAPANFAFNFKIFAIFYLGTGQGDLFDDNFLLIQFHCKRCESIGALQLEVIMSSHLLFQKCLSTVYTCMNKNMCPLIFLKLDRLEMA